MKSIKRLMAGTAGRIILPILTMCLGMSLFGETIQVVDAAGRQVSFDRPPQRIIVAGKSIPLMLDAVYLFPGMTERTVAVGRFFQGDGDFFTLLDPSFPEMPLIEQNFGPEQLAEYAPDIIIMKAYVRSSVGEPFETAGLPVFYVDLETPDSFFRDILSLGVLFGMEERAAEIVDFYSSRVRLVEERVKPLAEKEIPDVLFAYYSDVDGNAALNVPPAEWMQTLLVQGAGGNPVWTDQALGSGWNKTGMEQVSSWNPEVILLTAYRNDVAAVRSKLLTDPVWKLQQAVKENRFFAVPGDYFTWDQPNARWILGLLWTAKRLHPQLFSDVDLEAQVADFFREMYLLDDGTITQRILPAVQGDFR